MSRIARRLLLPGVAVLLVAAGVTFFVWLGSSTEYVPIVADSRQELIDEPALLTPGHLDRLEAVLKRYDVWYERVDATHLRIPRGLSYDRDLLRNYTTKAEEDPPTGG